MVRSQGAANMVRAVADELDTLAGRHVLKYHFQLRETQDQRGPDLPHYPGRRGHRGGGGDAVVCGAHLHRDVRGNRID